MDQAREEVISHLAYGTLTSTLKPTPEQLELGYISTSLVYIAGLALLTTTTSTTGSANGTDGTRRTTVVAEQDHRFGDLQRLYHRRCSDATKKRSPSTEEPKKASGGGGRVTVFRLLPRLVTTAEQQRVIDGEVCVFMERLERTAEEAATEMSRTEAKKETTAKGGEH